MAKRWAKTWKWPKSGENGKHINLTRTRTCPRVRAETPENGQASLNVTGTSTLLGVKAETPENGYAKGKNVVTADVGRKRASVA
jgi:hypothetical protein